MPRRPQFPVGDTSGQPGKEDEQIQVMRVDVAPQGVQTPLRGSGVSRSTRQTDLRSLGGYVLEATFTSNSVHTFSVRCEQVPQYIEPMDVPEHAEQTNIPDYVPSGVSVVAVEKSMWTKHAIKLQAISNDLYDTPYPFKQRFRVYAGSSSSTALESGSSVDVTTFRENVDDLLDGVSETPAAGKVPKAGADGKLDPDWLGEVGPNLLRLEDDFAGGIEDRTAADTGWSTSATGENAEAGHPGIVRLRANNALGVLPIGRVYSTDVIRLRAVVRPFAGTTTMSFRVGLLDNPNLSGEDSEGIYFSFSPGDSANWRVVTRDDSGKTATTSDVAYALDTWYLLEAIKSGSTYQFYVNGVLKATHSANIPAKSVYGVFAIESNEAVEKNVDADFFSLATVNTGRGA